MMNAIAIEHGDTTCAVEPGKFCLFFSTRKFGSIPVCTLFDQDLYMDVDNWTARCPRCMEIFTGDRIVTKEAFK